MAEITDTDTDINTEMINANRANVISRKKYDILKDRACKWRDMALDYNRRYDNILLENEKLIEENDELQEKLLSGQDSEDISEIMAENEEMRKELEIYKAKYKELRKQMRLIEKAKEEEILLEKLTQRIKQNITDK